MKLELAKDDTADPVLDRVQIVDGGARGQNPDPDWKKITKIIVFLILFMDDPRISY